MRATTRDVKIEIEHVLPPLVAGHFPQRVYSLAQQLSGGTARELQQAISATMRAYPTRRLRVTRQGKATLVGPFAPCVECGGSGTVYRDVSPRGVPVVCVCQGDAERRTA